VPDITITIEPEGSRLAASPGETFLDLAKRSGLALNSPCGGKGTCGNCRVIVTEGAQPATEEEQKFFSAEELAMGYHLACRMKLASPMRVLIPPETRAFDQHVLVEGSSRELPLAPLIAKIHVKSPAATIEDQRADADRLCEALNGRVGPAGIPHHIQKGLPAILRKNDFSVTAVLADGRLTGVESGDTTGRLYGTAFDIGTTTVVGFLADLRTGKLLATSSRTNPQISHGDDVVSRIHHISSRPTGLKELQTLIVKCVNEMLQELASAAGISTKDIYEVTLAGNTTMNHIITGVDPTYVAQSPYVAAVRAGQNIHPAELGIRINEGGNVYALPNIAAFVGGDTVAMILSAGLHLSDAMTLALDIGTNGELVLGSREKLICCSTAAGPAFEGARIAHGMRAADGAIDRVDWDGGDLRIHTLGDKKARGICGTGLIDAVAALLDAGVVDPTGLMQSPEEIPPQGAALAKRIVARDSQTAFQLVAARDSGLEKGIVLTQRDIREVQLAKGAISAGISVLMGEMGISADNLERIVLAGAFGNYIRKERAMRVGLIPSIPLDRVHFVGNAAGAGAKLALLAAPCRPEGEELSRRVRYVELGGRPDFQMLFAEAMIFPGEVP